MIFFSIGKIKDTEDFIRETVEPAFHIMKSILIANYDKDAMIRFTPVSRKGGYACLIVYPTEVKKDFFESEEEFRYVIEIRTSLKVTSIESSYHFKISDKKRCTIQGQLNIDTTFKHISTDDIVDDITAGLKKWDNLRKKT